jgi:hypothetical protein
MAVTASLTAMGKMTAAMATTPVAAAVTTPWPPP